MLAELAAWLTTPFPRDARRLGYLSEQIAIRARERRCRAAWAGHLAASREAMLAAAGPGGGLCVVAGAGLCLDVPLDGLAARFRRVVLLDLGFLERGGPRNVERMPWDATGAVSAWARDPAMDDATALAAVSPTWPAGLPEPDLLVSASLLSQLHLRPLVWLQRRRPRGPDFAAALGQRCSQAHLAWLRRHARRTLVIADRAQVARRRDGGEADREPTGTDGLGLGPPERTWTWRIAPAPEWDPVLDLEHEVGAWLTERCK